MQKVPKSEEFMLRSRGVGHFGVQDAELPCSKYRLLLTSDHLLHEFAVLLGKGGA